MKKFILSTVLVMVSFITFSQEKTYVISRKQNDVNDTKKPYSAVVFVKENTIEFREMGVTKSYNIKKKQVVNDNVTICLVNDGTEDSEFLISENPKVIEHTKTYKRLLDDQPKKSTMLYYFTGNMNRTPNVRNPHHYYNSEKEGSFGAVAGATTMIGEAGNFLNFSGGGWIEYKNFGVEYVVSSSVTDDIMAENFVSGQVGKWIAGGSAKSFGGFYKQDNGLYYGAGVQTSWVMGLENVSISYTYYDSYIRQNRTGYRIEMKDVNEKKTLPYVTVGYLKNLGDWFTFKGGIIISKFTSINVGVGYSF
jgi:hypothetical protein